MFVVIAIHNVQPRPQSVDAHKMPAKEESAMDRVLPAYLFIQCLCLVYNIVSSTKSWFQSVLTKKRLFKKKKKPSDFSKWK